MPNDRREFLGALAALPFAPDALRAFITPTPSAAPWDLSWTDRVKGRYRAVFDVAEIDSGFGVWRASLWARDYMQTLGAKPAELSPVIVLRSHAIALAMQQAYWTKHRLGKATGTMHPLTQQPTDRSPVLLSSSRNEVPPELDDVALDRFMAHGGIVLACSVALDDLVEGVVKRDGGTADAVRKQAVAALVPGVILQPSGVFAASRAQDAGCRYVRSS